MYLLRYFLFPILVISCTAYFSTAQNALDFDGVNDHVQTDYQGILGDSARTIEAWIKTTANAVPTNGGLQQTIVDWGMFSGQGHRFTFNVLWANAIRLEVGGNGVSGTIPVNDGAWHHVAVTFDPTQTDQIRLYVDGQLDVAGTTTVPVNTQSNVDMQIGLRVDGVNPFTGSIDEVRVWDIALDQTKIQNHMNKEFCEPSDNLIAYYTFNQGTAGEDNASENTLIDLSGNNYTGSLTNFSLNGSASNWVDGGNVNAGILDAIIMVDACEPYTWAANGMTYTDSGAYTALVPGTIGCDTSFTLNLNIMPLDASAVLNGITLSANTTDAEYQWVDCDNNFAAIPNETGQDFTPSTSGNYAVSVSQNGCTEMSDCFLVDIVSVNDPNKNPVAELSPNPTRGNFYIKMNKTFEQVIVHIYDLSGQKISSKNFHQLNTIPMELTQPKGVYLLVLESEGLTIERFKVVKN